MDSKFVYYQIPVIIDIRSGTSDSNIGSSTSTEEGILSTATENGGSVKKIEPDTTALIHIPFTKPKSVNPDVINFTEDFMVELVTDYNRQNQGLVKVPEEHDDDSMDDDPSMPYANKRQKQAFKQYFATNPFPPPDKDSCKKDEENRKSKSKKQRFQEDAQMMPIDQSRGQQKNHPNETPQVVYARMMEQIDFALEQIDLPMPVYAAPIPEHDAKKKAKHKASRLALMSLLGPKYYNSIVDHQSKHISRPVSKAVKSSPLDTAKSPDQRKCGNVEEGDDREYSLAFAQKMAERVTEKYGELVKNDKKYAAAKVTAGVVMTLGNPLIDNMHVISVATGTKCIEGDNMSDQGLSVNDCHAEILATRCLGDFIFSQIEGLRNMANWTDVKPEAMNGIILEKIEQTTEDEVTSYKLKENVQFHLYISTSPCGDEANV